MNNTYGISKRVYVLMMVVKGGRGTITDAIRDYQSLNGITLNAQEFQQVYAFVKDAKSKYTPPSSCC